MNKAVHIRDRVRNWPGSGEVALFYKPHRCAYCNETRCSVSSADTSKQGDIIWFTVHCKDCGRNDVPGISSTSLLSVLMQIG